MYAARLALVLVVFTSEMIITSNSQCINCGKYGRCLDWNMNSTANSCNLCACPSEIRGNCCQNGSLKALLIKKRAFSSYSLQS
jgi:hypothetical protein